MQTTSNSVRIFPFFSGHGWEQIHTFFFQKIFGECWISGCFSKQNPTTKGQVKHKYVKIELRDTDFHFIFMEDAILSEMRLPCPWTNSYDIVFLPLLTFPLTFWKDASFENLKLTQSHSGDQMQLHLDMTFLLMSSIRILIRHAVFLIWHGQNAIQIGN